VSPCGSVVSARQGQVQGYLTFLVVQHINCSEHNDLLPRKNKIFSGHGMPAHGIILDPHGRFGSWIFLCRILGFGKTVKPWFLSVGYLCLGIIAPSSFSEIDFNAITSAFDD
jgi:hypothetical protein